MALLAQQQEDENQKQSGGQNQVPLIPTLAGSGASSQPTSSGTPQGTTNTASPGAAPSAPWSNIGAYLSANQPQSKQTADAIAGNFNKSLGDIQTQTAAAEKNFTNSINQNTIGLDQNLFNAAKSNPTEFAKDPTNVAAFQKAYGASYGGPQSFETTPEYAKIQNAIQAGQTNAGLIKQGSSGIESLLQNTGNNATPGQNALDSLLLQENPDNFNSIKASAAPFSNLTSFLNGKTSDLDNMAQTAAQTTANTKSAFNDAFVGANGVVPTFKQNFDSRLANARSEATNNAAKYQQDILGKTPALSQQELQSLNIGPDTWSDILKNVNGLQKTYAAPTGDPTDAQNEIGDLAGLESLYGQNVDLSPYVTASDANASINPTNFANDQDYAEAAALSQLTGENSFLDPAQAKQAQTFNPNLVDFNARNADADASKHLNENDQQVLGRTPVGYAGKDAGFSQLLNDVYSRNAGSLTPAQAQWMTQQTGGGQPVKPPAPPTPAVPSQTGDTRINPDTKQYEYFNGTQWTASPAEFTGWDPASGGYTKHFNPKTGQYEAIPQAKRPGSGVFRAS